MVYSVGCGDSNFPSVMNAEMREKFDGNSIYLSFEKESFDDFIDQLINIRKKDATATHFGVICGNKIKL